MYVNAKFPGSCHDSGIWTTSPVRRILIEKYKPQQFNWLLGDSGYPLEPWLLTPVVEAETVQEERFNKLHATARNTIERAFGVLKSRFRCIHKDRTLHYKPPKAAKIIYACIILHNILINTGFLDQIRVDEDIEDNDVENVMEVPRPTPNEYFSEGRRIRSTYIDSI